MAKPKIDPIEQGSIQEVYRRFIAPLVKYKPEAMELKDWMEGLFHHKDRDISRYVVTIPFNLPGLYHLSANQKVQGLGSRWLFAGNVLFVRQDLTQPDIVEVEVVGGHGKENRMFSLTLQEWESHGRCVLLAERVAKK
jgi:hypothetical protein